MAAHPSSPTGRESYREILVFLPDDAPDGTTPLETAHALTAAVGVGRAVIGADALTGAVEVRFYYDPMLFQATRAYAREQGIVCEIDRR
jgi:hypothetical protein